MATILLVEDDSNLREIYEARLAAEGYTIVSAQNGEEALVLAKQNRPDLVISDVMMPRISGYEMLDILRNTDELRDTKVIMLTALGQAEDKDRAGKLGADKYLVKSQVTLEDIVNSAKALFSDGEVPAIIAEQAQAPVTPTPTDNATVTAATAGSSTVPATELASPIEAVSPVPAENTPAPATLPEPATPVPPTAETLGSVAAIEPPAGTPSSTPFDITTPASAIESPAPVIPGASPSIADSAPLSPQSVTGATPPTDVAASVPVSVDEVIAAQPDATGAVEASSTTVAEVQNTPLAETSLPTGEPKTLAEEEAALEAHMQALAEPSTPTPPPTAEAAPSDAILTQALESLVDPTAADALPAVGTTETPTATPTSVSTPIAPVEPPPVAVAPEPSVDTDNDTVTVAGKKVIQPISDPATKPDINALLAVEEAKSIVTDQPSVIVDSAAPPQPDEQITPTNPEQPVILAEKPAPRVIDPSQPDPGNIAL